MVKASLKKPKRDLYLDALKGLAILLVVLGHSVQSAYSVGGEFDQNVLFRVIYSFHMPLFMFLSGAIATYGTAKMGLYFIKKKFFILVVPFFCWYLVSYFINRQFLSTNVFSYFHELIISPDRGLWFLWVLFFAFCALATAQKLRVFFGNGAYLIIWLAILAIPTGYYGIGLLKWQLPFFFLGYLLFIYKKQLLPYLKPILLLCVVSFPALVLTWYRLSLPASIMALEPRLAAHNLLVVPIGDFVSLNIYQLVATGYKYVVALSGIGFIFWLMSQKIFKSSWGIFAFFGLYTLDIYAIQFYFLQFGFGPKWLNIISSFIIATSASLLIGKYVLRKVPVLDTLLLGGRTSKR